MSQPLLPFDEPSENRWVLCGNISEVTEGRGLALEVQGVRLAVFYVDGQLDILEGRCPHANAPLGRGWLDGSFVGVSTPTPSPWRNGRLMGGK